MIDQESEAFKAAAHAYIVTREGQCLDHRSALIAALEAYEAARPKLPTITGLPETLPDGTRIVGWRWGMTGPGDWHVSPVSDTLLEANLGGFLRVIAITETDNG